MPDSETRRAQMRERLQARVRSREVSDPSQLSASALLTLCERDTAALVALIDNITPIGFPTLENVRWLAILRAVEAGVDRMLHYKANGRVREIRFHVRGRDGSRQAEKARATEEAVILLERVRGLIERLPDGAMCADLKPLGFRPVTEVTANAAARPRQRAGDYDAAEHFMGALRDLEKLGLKLDPIIKETAQYAMDRRQKEVVLQCISALLSGYKMEMDHEDRLFRLLMHEKPKREVVAFERRKREQGVIVTRLEKWIEFAEGGSVVAEFNLRLDD